MTIPCRANYKTRKLNGFPKMQLLALALKYLYRNALSKTVNNLWISKVISITIKI